MSGFLLSMLGAASQGVLWGVMVLGVYITYKILDVADLTVDGSFALGGCVCATLVVGAGWNPILALLMSFIAGLLAGAITGFLHTVFEIPAILAGILTMISLWSINLRIMGGKSNIPLLKLTTVFSWIVDRTGLKQAQAALVIGVVVAIFLIAALYWFFGTELGAAIRATGDNEDMVRALGVNTKRTKLLGLMISNGLVGLSGGLVCQSQKYGDINMGTGAIVIGLASIVIGGVIMGRLRSFNNKLSSAVVGAVVYFLIRAIVLRLGMDANDMKLLSAVIVAFALWIPAASAKWRTKRSYSEGRF
ncbi:ABC transporter permease [Bacteroidia bacterium]|nr:ABC transporter permease [Bacteroidia bacterium]